MKVCIATTSFPRWPSDGEGAFIWEAARAIARYGVQIRVITMHSPGVPTWERIGDIEVVRPRYWRPEKWEILRKEGGGLPASLRERPHAYFQLPVLALAQALAVSRVARDCDVIHGHWTLSAACACLGQPFHRRPVVATLHGSDVYQATKNPALAWLTKRALRRCAAFTMPSSDLLSAATSIGLPSERMQVISNGVDTELFRPLPDRDREDTLLFVGSLIQRKGVVHLLAAMQEVLGQFPGYRLVLVGEGPQRALLQQTAGNLGIGGRVIFLGQQAQDEVRAQMRRAKLLVLPSLEEGQGVVVLEALACGTPVVASKVGGIPEVVTDSVGTLVPPADPRALSMAICSALSSPKKWEDMSQKARERAVHHYDWGRLARRYIGVYESALRNRDAD